MDASELLKNYAAGERNFSGFDLSEADLFAVNLSGANLIDVDLSGAYLSRANLSEANLSGAKLIEAYLNGANLSGANLFNVDLSRAYLSEANLSGANLIGANLSRANLSEANLSGANLSGANLSGADLSGANLFETDLTNANANLSGAKLDGTILAYQEVAEELQQENQELKSRIEFLESELEKQKQIADAIAASNQSVNAPYDWTKPLRSLQADFIQRLKSNDLLRCDAENLHSEATIIPRTRLEPLLDSCLQMVRQHQKEKECSVFMKHIKGKLEEEFVKIRLANLVITINYMELKDCDRKIDFNLIAKPQIGIQIKTRHCDVDKAEWGISEEEIKKNKVLVCILIQEEISMMQNEYHLILAGFLPTQLIRKQKIRINELLYGGGLRGYLESMIR